MTARRTYIVPDDNAGLRLDVLLGTIGAFPSRSSAVRSLESGGVLVNGEAVSKRYEVEEGTVYSMSPMRR